MVDLTDVASSLGRPLADLAGRAGCVASGWSRKLTGDVYIARHCRVFVLANKADVLPRVRGRGAVGDSPALRAWLTRQCASVGLRAAHVHVVAAAKGSGMREAMAVRAVPRPAGYRSVSRCPCNTRAQAVDKARGGRDVHLIGYVNVGKSTVVSRLVASGNVRCHCVGVSRDRSAVIQAPTVSRYPGTTVGLVRLAIDARSELIDTPGLLNGGAMTALLTDAELKVRRQ